MGAERLSPGVLLTPCDPNAFGFRTTAELPEVEGLVGQTRASEAIELGLSVRRPGYNLFVLGPPGTGRHSAVRSMLTQRASKEPAPDDWCYVHNFDDPRRPRLLRLPPGRAKELRGDMEHLIGELRQAIPSVFESDAYRTRRKAIEEEIQGRQDDRLEQIAKEARERGIALVRTPMGFALAPLKDGEVIGPDEVAKLPDADKKHIQEEMERVHGQVHEVLEKVPEWQREGRDRIRDLDRGAIKSMVGRLFDEVRHRYAKLEQVGAFLDRVEEDVLANASEFLSDGQEQEGPLGALGARVRQEAFRRYEVNVMVDRSEAQGAPVVHENHPTLSNLVGRIEHRSQLGTLSTDFNLIEAGALHRANGGYLLLDARDLLTQPYAWQELKRVLRAREVRIESPMEALGLPSTVSLDPEPIPFDAKVVLVGERLIYYLLCAADPDFANLFKVSADFDDLIDRDAQTMTLYARVIATMARREELRPLDAAAVAKLIDQASRLAEDAGKLSMRMRTMLELVVEAEHYAGLAGRDVVSRDDVRAAVDARLRRTGRMRDRSLEAMGQGVIRIETEGVRVGSLNGLSVLELADVRFGRPTRITARAGLGRGEVIDIEREVELGGPIHSKGVLILQGFLIGQYGAQAPLALKASLVFEQSYGGVEGDSASLAELCALLSAVGELPVRQDVAITGSVDQFGQVQAVGAVNDKIEGFFDLCAQRGLSGSQGVVLPSSNVRHLMLREDVVEAVREEKFHVHSVADVDEAMELLTGKPAGERREDGSYPEGSVHAAVAARLARLVEAAKALQPHHES